MSGRPEGYVAWRSATVPISPVETIAGALRQILDRHGPVALYLRRDRH